MLNSVKIAAFRNFTDFTLQKLKRVNLIAGLNNTGKTALLEALFILLKMKDVARLPTAFRVAGPNVDQNETFWRWLFYDKRTDKPARISASHSGVTSSEIILASTAQAAAALGLGAMRQVGNAGPVVFFSPANLTLPNFNTSIFSTNPTNPVQDAADFNQVVLTRRKKRVEDLLRQIEPRLQAIEFVQKAPNQPAVLYADLELSEMIPVTQLGQGFCRLLAIYTGLMAADVKILLIDEIENGIHYTVLPVLWKGLALASKELGVQIFGTTHSLECIVAAHEAFKELPDYDFAFHRLQIAKGKIEAVTHDKQMLDVALETDLELR